MNLLLDLADKYCERYTKELDDQFRKIEKSNQLSPADVEMTDALWHSIKSILTSKAMLESYDDRYSGAYYSGNSMSGDHYNRMYPKDYSGRGRDNMGRYTRDNDKASMMGMLEDKMRSARSEDEAMAINDAMAAISRLR